MSESLLPIVDSTDAESIDRSIQRMWDRYATPDRSVDPDSLRQPRVSDSPSSSDVVMEALAIASDEASIVTSNDSFT